MSDAEARAAARAADIERVRDEQQRSFDAAGAKAREYAVVYCYAHALCLTGCTRRLVAQTIALERQQMQNESEQWRSAQVRSK